MYVIAKTTKGRDTRYWNRDCFAHLDGATVFDTIDELLRAWAKRNPDTMTCGDYHIHKVEKAGLQDVGSIA